MRRKAQDKVAAGIIEQDVVDAYRDVSTVAAADHFIHAPLNGYPSGAAYWRDASSKPLIGSIETPTLVVMARDDFMLSAGSYPIEESLGSPYVNLEMPERGSHVAFVPRRRKKVYWSEGRTSRFLNGASRL